MVKLEKGTTGDIEEITRLYDELNDYLASHTNYPGWIKGIYPIRETALMGLEKECLYVLRLDGRIAGTLILNHEPEESYLSVDWGADLDYKDIFIIHTFALHPAYLRQGLGKDIVEWVINFCQEAGALAIRLDTYEKNMPAIHLYKNCGFQYIDTVDLGYGQYGLERFELYQKLLQA